MNHIFVGKDFVLTVGHGEGPDLSPIRRRLEADSSMLARGLEVMLYAILDQAVDCSM